MKRKKMLSLMLAGTMVVLCAACANKEKTDDVIVRDAAIVNMDAAPEGTSERMSGVEKTPEEESSAETEDISGVESAETQMSSEEASEADVSSEEMSETVESELETETQTLNEIERLTEGEKKARREQQENFAEARETLYQMKNSKDKTMRINQMDRQILANNSYDFSKKNIVFIGDSITEGITSAVDQNGNFVSYVTYVNSYLHFKKVLNHGVGGRMFSNYGGDELSIAINFDRIMNMDSDIVVIFAGINDYLTTPDNKRFGDVGNTTSTAGFCGAVRQVMKQLQTYYADKEIFFVTMYNVSKTAECAYSDYNGQPTLKDYMDAERQLAQEYGFHIIDLYNTGIMDCSNKETSDYYLRDSLHPKDNGNIVLGEHIAAELSLYFSQKAE